MAAMLAQLALAGLVTAAAEAAAPKPHIVYILSDNLCAACPPPLHSHPHSTTGVRRAVHSGWGNVGYHRKHSSPSPEVVTPRLDELVATGIELDRHCARHHHLSNPHPRLSQTLLSLRRLQVL